MVEIAEETFTEFKMKIRKFCCCFSLEFGAFVIGIVRLIWACIDGFSKITGGFSLLFNECKEFLVILRG